jgi:hypothetical protein
MSSLSSAVAVERSSQFLTIPFPASGLIAMPFAGTDFFLVSADGPVRVKLGKQIEATLKPGESLKMGTPFERVEIRRVNATATQVEIWVGFAEFRSNRFNQIEAATEFVPVADGGAYVAGVLAAAGVLDLPGTPTNARIRRKAVQIFNMSPDANVELRDAAGLVGGVVRPGETITQPVSGFIRIANPTLAGLALRVSELWWLA